MPRPRARYTYWGAGVSVPAVSAAPMLGLSFALTRVLRLVVSGGYRFAVVQAWSGPTDRLLGGFTGTLAFRLGKF